jgi:hypothetical protein
MRKALITLLMVLPPTVWAISAAPPNQVLCASSYIVVGHVTGEPRWVCDPPQQPPCANYAGRLIVQVEQILGNSNPALPASRELRVGDSVTLSVLAYSTDGVDYGRSIRDPAAKGPALNIQDLNTLVIDKPLIYSIDMRERAPRDSGYRSGVWRIERRAWVEDEMSRLSKLQDAQCPRPAGL